MNEAGAEAGGMMRKQDLHPRPDLAAAEQMWLLCIQVPVLFDKKIKTIVSNESADIIRMLATECQVCPHTDSPAVQDSYDSSMGHD